MAFKYWNIVFMSKWNPTQNKVCLWIDKHKIYLSKQIALCPACSAATTSAVGLIADRGALFTAKRSRI